MAITKKNAIISKEAGTDAENGKKNASPAFRGTQQELYLYSTLGWTNYNSYQKDFANQFSTSFTAALG